MRAPKELDGNILWTASESAISARLGASLAALATCDVRFWGSRFAASASRHGIQSAVSSRFLADSYLGSCA